MTVSGQCALAVPVGSVDRDERAVTRTVISVRDKRGTLGRWRIVIVPDFE